MPELPEVETIKNKLKKKLVGKTIIGVDIYYNVIEEPTPEIFRKKILNQTIIDIKRRGKFLMFELNDYFLLCHLRMEGKLFTDGKINMHDHVVFKFKDGFLKYNDTRKFGKMYLLPKNDIYNINPLSKLGLEPFDEMLTIEYLKSKISKRRVAIKQLLLDQSIISGIGNIYADEILYKSFINPLRKGNTLNSSELASIITNTREILKNAIQMGGTTIRSYESERGVHGTYQDNLLVHNHAGYKCKNCKSVIVKIEVNGRGTYYCPKCQKI